MEDYRDHVEPGGPALSRTVDTPETTVEIRKLSVGPMDNNVYLLRDTATDALLLIDAANDAERILAELGDADVTAILTTHGHRDHWGALAAVADATGAPTYLHPADADMVPRDADHAISDEQTLVFGRAAVQLLHTPGHTPGSTCVVLHADREHVFSGDTLFPGGPGRTTSPEAFRTIMRSLRECLFSLSDSARVYPGHGDGTTLSAERPHLDQWQARGW